MNTVTPVVLAAGDSSRMGYPKALLPLGKGTFVTRILDTLQPLGLRQPVLVLGVHAQLIEPALGHRLGRIVINRDPSRGTLSSIQLAIGALEPDSEACLVWPVDQPLIPGEVVAGILQLFQDTKAPIVLPQCANQRGHPALFRRSLFDELLSAPRATGAKIVVQRHQNEIAVFETEDSATIADIDTPEDYERYIGEPLQAALSRFQSERHS